MKLKKLEITGFKSFMGKTRILFPPGTTGMVGPNGCGKSNVVDALKWVMGEQNVRKLRGKTSEDIIFAGSTGSPPMNMAEVSLTIDNEDASIVGPFNECSEITVTRRIFRSGESHTLINRQPARLKDIQTLFLGSGTGKNAFAVIQQGNIGALTEASPEERRVFIEEAADVTKYKAQKRETESKIKATRENLERIGDIVMELERQLEVLNTQAQKAILFKSLQKDIRDIDITLSGAEYQRLAKKVNDLTASTKHLTHQCEADTSRREAISSALKRLTLHIQTTNDAIEAHHQKIFELKRGADRHEGTIAHLKEKSRTLTHEVDEDTRHLEEALAKNQELSDEIRTIQSAHTGINQAVTALETKRKAAENQRNACQKELFHLEKKSQDEATRHRDLLDRKAIIHRHLSSAERLFEDTTRKLKMRDEELARAHALLTAAHEKKNGLDEESIAMEGALEGLKTTQKSLHDTIETMGTEGAHLRETLKEREIEEGRIRSALETIERMLHSGEGYGDGVKEGMKCLNALGASQPEVVANLIRVEKEYETAVETALGEILTHIVVHTPDIALRGGQAMLRPDAPRCGFFAPGLNPLAPFSGAPLTGCRPLTDFIELDDRLTAPFPALLSRLFVTQDLATALTAKGETTQMVAIATLDGCLVDFSGAVVAGKNGASASLLKRRREIEETEKKRALITAEIKALTARQQTHQGEITTKREALRHGEDQLKERRNHHAINERARLLTGEEVKQRQRDLSRMTQETETLDEDLSELDIEIEAHRKKQITIEAEIKRHLTGEEIAGETLIQARTTLSQIETAITKINLDLVREESKDENHQNTVSRLTGFLTDSQTRIKRLSEGISKKTGESRAASKQAEEMEKGLVGAFLALETAEGALAVTRSHLSRFESDRDEKERVRKELSATHGQRLESLRKEEVALAGFLTRAEELKTRTLEQYQTPIEALMDNFETQIHEVLDGKTDKESLSHELKSLKRKINRMGDINTAAVSQCEEMKKRHGFLSEQQSDLTASLKDLEAIIEKINRITQKRFIDTFHRINEKLAEIFPRLFEGGTARLILTDQKNPLETGVELMIQPPGKKSARLSLLSGGEKALSAIAFVFSIFLLKPSSFCVMDEIDAPLDDANVLRFNNLLTIIAENSQTLVITHNKITMEHADVLIGVTMEKKGVSKVVTVNLTGRGIPSETSEIESA